MLDANPSSSPSSFESLVAEHLPMLRRRATRLARTRHDADDLVQDALLRALRGQARMRSAAAARGWLLTVISSTFLDQLRRRRVRPHELPISHEPVDPECTEEPPWAPPHDQPAPACTEEPPWSRLSVDDVRAAVERLPADVRTAYRMFELEGRDYITIARTLDIPRGTVGSRIARARKQLRELLLAAPAP